MLHGHFDFVDFVPVVLTASECLLHGALIGVRGGVTPILGAI
jgi:hypothetical protein